MTPITIIIISCVIAAIVYVAMTKYSEHKQNKKNTEQYFSTETTILCAFISGLISFVIMSNLYHKVTITDDNIEANITENALPALEYDKIIDIEEGMEDLPPIFHKVG